MLGIIRIGQEQDNVTEWDISSWCKTQTDLVIDHALSKLYIELGFVETALFIMVAKFAASNLATRPSFGHFR